MIGWLKGNLAEKTPTRIVVDVQGVGYELLVPVSTFEQLGEIGATIKVLTYLHVREDILQLYGFHSTKEKQMFLSLLSISGIGPKLALGILSGNSVDELTVKIANGDVDSLTRLQGVGKKTAQRLVMELKDKFVEIAGTTATAVPASSVLNSKQQEAVLALVSLGFSRTAAEKTLAGIIAKEPDLGVDDMIRRALK